MDKVYMRGAYKEGFESYRVNSGQYKNPYPANPPEHNGSERDWSQALKRLQTPPPASRNPYAEVKGKRRR